MFSHSDARTVTAVAQQAPRHDGVCGTQSPCRTGTPPVAASRVCVPGDDAPARPSGATCFGWALLRCCALPVMDDAPLRPLLGPLAGRPSQPRRHEPRPDPPRPSVRLLPQPRALPCAFSGKPRCKSKPRRRAASTRSSPNECINDSARLGVGVGGWASLAVGALAGHQLAWLGAEPGSGRAGRAGGEDGPDRRQRHHRSPCSVGSPMHPVSGGLAYPVVRRRSLVSSLAGPQMI